MHFLCSGFSEHMHDSVRSGSPDDRIIDHNDSFSIHHFLQGIQFYLDTALPGFLLRLDEGSANIGIFYESRPIGDSRLQRISHGRTVS